jgi:hypothetical protein
MATGNTFTGVGGLDGSIQFEMESGENEGSAFKTSLLTYEPFFSSRTSISDIIAAGVYTAVRSCGGPEIAVRGGRIDANSSGPIGTPLPQNALAIFRQQFLRFGYNETEMIAFTACGHTLGGVHSESFPDHVPPGTVPDDVGHLDTTPANFDNRIAIEFVDKSTADPLVISNTRQNSDLVVFSSDRDGSNATIKSLTDPAVFQGTCKTMFERMINTVPSGVTLSEVIQPYEVKPYGAQLTLLAGGSKIKFAGDIRVRTTQRPASSITSVNLLYKDRAGAEVSKSIAAIYKGAAQGFDDTFAFYHFDTILSASSSISSFVVTVASSDLSETFDNNGLGFKVDDTVILQEPQSCLNGAGQLTAVAAVRDGESPPDLKVVLKVPRPSPSIIPSLSTVSIPMATESAVGSYQLYSASYSFSTDEQANSAEFGISDALRKLGGLSTACAPLSTAPPTNAASFEFQGCYSDEGPVRTLDKTVTANATMTIETCATFCAPYRYFGLEYGNECYCGNAIHTSSEQKPLSECNMPCAGDPEQLCGAGFRLSTYKNLDYTAPDLPSLSGYEYLGCIADSRDDRVLPDKTSVLTNMTYASCADFCTGYQYFGVEFGTECFCGNGFDNSTTRQPEIECDMACTGNASSTCGAPYRISVFKSNANITLPQNPVIPGYNYSGCYVDSVAERVLQKAFFFDAELTVEKCLDYCDGTKYFGTEYGGECYCGDEFAVESEKVAESQCSHLCLGDMGQFCGAANRLSLWTRVGNGTFMA